MSQPNMSMSMDEGDLERQYTEYKKQFEEWKQQNKDHPDKTAFNQYVDQWKQWEQQVEQRRQFIKQMKQMQQQTQAQQSQNQFTNSNPAAVMSWPNQNTNTMPSAAAPMGNMGMPPAGGDMMSMMGMYGPMMPMNPINPMMPMWPMVAPNPMFPMMDMNMMGGMMPSMNVAGPALTQPSMGQAGSQPTPVPPPPQSNQPVKPQLPSGPSENKPESSNAPSGAFFTRNTRWDDNKAEASGATSYETAAAAESRGMPVAYPNQYQNRNVPPPNYYEKPVDRPPWDTEENEPQLRPPWDDGGGQEEYESRRFGRHRDKPYGRGYEDSDSGYMRGRREWRGGGGGRDGGRRGGRGDDRIRDRLKGGGRGGRGGRPPPHDIPPPTSPPKSLFDVDLSGFEPPWARFQQQPRGPPMGRGGGFEFDGPPPFRRPMPYDFPYGPPGQFYEEEENFDHYYEEPLPRDDAGYGEEET